MHILKDAGTFEILDTQEELTAQLLTIERAGRTCYQSIKGEITPESAAKFIRMILKRGHESVIEHSKMTVVFSGCSRGMCYDEETQVLTREGWKFFRDCDIQRDLFATLNPETMGLEFQQATDRTDEPWEVENGPMYRVSSEMVDLLVTPTHRMFIRRHDTQAAKRGEQPWEICQARHIRGKRVHYKKNISADLEEVSEDLIIYGFRGPYGSGGRVITSQDLVFESNTFMKFLGFWISEGSLDHTPGSGYRVNLSQNGGPVLEEMRETIQKLGFEPSTRPNGKTGNIQLSFCSLTLFKYLENLGTSLTKYVPRPLLDLPACCLRKFLDSCIAGDGNTHKANGHQVIYTSSPQLADDLQEIALRVGVSARIRVDDRVGESHVISTGQTITNRNPGYVVSLAMPSRQEPLVNHNGRKHDSPVNYQGMVRCVTVPNGILYVRRNGVPVWCGNTHEQVRHRLCAFSQESTRYVDYAKGGDENPDLDAFQLRCIVPPHRDENEVFTIPLGEAGVLVRWEGEGDPRDIPADMKVELLRVTPAQMFQLYEACYRALRKGGWKPEDARQFLPIGIKSQIVISANWREWRHIFKMRTGKPAHWEIRAVMCRLLKQVQEMIPVVFDDFVLAGEDAHGVPYYEKTSPGMKKK